MTKPTKSTKPIKIDIKDIEKEVSGKVVLWASADRLEQILQYLDYPSVIYPKTPSADIDTLIVIGGGTIIDCAKVWRHETGKQIKLIVIPSIWGSGAEISPVSLLNVDGHKEIKKGEKYLPDSYSIINQLTVSLTDEQIKMACGDVWAHALEGFLSPLGSDDLRKETADLIINLLKTPIENNGIWFDLSARACLAQTASSVGMIHGIAHVLEGVVEGDVSYGHAKLCSVYLYPVMSYNMSINSKVIELLSRYGLDAGKVLRYTENFFDKKAYLGSVPYLKDNWKTILRDQSTRTNSVLVKVSHLTFFERFPF